MKTQYILTALVLFLLASCTPDPSREILEHYYFYFEDDNQNRLLAGETKDIVLNYERYKNTDAPADSIMVVFEPVTGGGSVSPSLSYVTPSKDATAEWQLGTNACKQRMRTSFYDLSGRYLTQVDRIAYGFRENEWDEISEDPDAGIRDMVADTVNKITLMVANSEVYRQGERYFIWEPVEEPEPEWDGVPRTIEIDSHGLIYVSTWKGELYKSTDHGNSWTECTKPYPDRHEYIYNYVSNDDDVWAYAHGYPIKRSRDGGLTWEVISGLEGAGFGDVFRLTDGRLLFHGSNCCSLHISDDDGASWTHIPTPGNSIKLYVNDDDEIIICTEYSGLDFYRSTDYGETFTLVHHTAPEYGTVMRNTFTRSKDFYYVLVPGYGILKTYDLVNYEAYWSNSELIDLFIDHKGVLIARDFDSETVYYRHNTE